MDCKIHGRQGAKGIKRGKETYVLNKISTAFIKPHDIYHANRRHPTETTWFLLVVEETGVLLDKGNAELFGGAEDCLVVLAASRGGNVLDARAGSTEDVVDEGELWKAG